MEEAQGGPCWTKWCHPHHSSLGHTRCPMRPVVNIKRRPLSLFAQQAATKLWAQDEGQILAGGFLGINLPSLFI